MTGARETRKIDNDTIEITVRGRPISLYVPQQYQPYDLEAEVRSDLSPNITNSSPQTEAPSVTPSLEWTYGYRGKDSRSNLYSLPTGEICYYVSSLAVLYNPESQTQRHYRGHTDDIECLAPHPQLPLCATGQASGSDPSQQDSAHVQVRRSTNYL